MGSFHPRRFAKPDRLQTIDPEVLRQFLTPWREYLTSRGFALAGDEITPRDCLTLGHILMSPDTETPLDLIDALHLIHEVAGEATPEDLVKRLRDLGVDASGSDPLRGIGLVDLVIRLWLASPDALRACHAELAVLRQQRFDYFAGAGPRSPGFPGADETTRRAIERDLDNWFDANRRGRGSRIFFHPDRHKVWITVRHGDTFRREPGHGEDGDTIATIYRPQVHDVLIYDVDADELGVHAGTKGLVELYLRTIGEHVFGNPRRFLDPARFSLMPLIKPGAQSMLCEDIEGLASVRLVELHRAFHGGFKEVEIRKATDLFAALAKRKRSISRTGKLTCAQFKVRFADTLRERAVTIRMPASARYQRNEDSELIERWLVARGFLQRQKATVHADQTAQAALDGA